jgi:hypothetical protein
VPIEREINSSAITSENLMSFWCEFYKEGDKIIFDVCRWLAKENESFENIENRKFCFAWVLPTPSRLLASNVNFNWLPYKHFF